MPISRIMDKALGLSVVKGSGMLTDEDFIKYTAALREDPDGQNIRAELLDLRAADFDLSPSGVRRVVDFDRRILSDYAELKRALVVSTDLQYSLARLYVQLMTPQGVEVEAFRDLDAARKWLGLPAEEQEVEKRVAGEARAAVTSAAIKSAIDFARGRRGDHVNELNEFLSIQSISDDPTKRDEMIRAAEWLVDRLTELGAKNAELVATEGHPVVYGEMLDAGPKAPTVLVYGHYDVQPVSSPEDWSTDPFTPVEVGGNLVGRGTSDMKGQIMACIAAIEAVVETVGLPVNIRFVLEGEEEVGSPHFESFLEGNLDRLACDVVLNTDAGMLGPDDPTIFYGLRGMYSCRLRVSGPSEDLHSGGYGGVIHNPIHALSLLIAGLHDAEGRVQLPDFYKSVRPMTNDEREMMEALPLDEEAYLEQSGADSLWGEPEYLPAERAGARPALDIIQFRAGSAKSAIPADAEAVVTVRLVPDQIPADVHEQFVSYLAKNTPPTVRWEIVEWKGFPAVLTDRSSPGITAMGAAMESIWGKGPLFYRSGGSIAAVGHLKAVLGVDSVMTGFSLPDDHIHGPNEHLHLSTWGRGIEALIHFLHNFAR